MSPESGFRLKSRTVWLMAIACGVTVANNYYSQPLLALISRSFNVSEQVVGSVPTLAQLGIAFGVFLLLPLGDILERRRLIVTLVAATAFTLVAIAIAPNILWLDAASLVMGFTTVTPYLIPPFAVHLAAAQEQGKVVGTVVSGLLVGILLARTVSGFVAASFSWRAIYWFASGIMVILALVLNRELPKSKPSSKLSYWQLMQSLWSLLREQPELRRTIVIQAMLFGAFNAFWVTLTFLLENSPYHYGSQVAGLFGLLGAIGATATPFVGKLTDRHSPKLTVGLALITTLLSFIVLGVFGYQLAGLVVGVILLDLGVNSGHVSNQALIYSLVPEARSRLNTIYVVVVFLGGALGSSLSVYCWSIWRWHGVCILGLVMVSVALAAHYRRKSHKRFTSR